MSKVLEKLQVIIEGNTKKYKDSLKDAIAETEKATNTINKAVESTQSPFKDVVQTALKQIRTGVGDKIKDFQIESGIKTYTDEYKALQADAEQAEKALERLRKKQLELRARGEHKQVSKGTAQEIDATNKKLEETKWLLDSIKNMPFVVQQEIRDLENEIQHLQSRLETLRKTDAGSESWKRLQSEIDKTEQKINNTSKSMQRLKSSGEGLKFAGLRNMISGFGSNIGSKLNGLTNAFSNVNPAVRMLTSTFSILGRIFSIGTSTVQRLTGSMHELGNSGHRLGGIFRTLSISARFMFASFLIRGALNAAREGMQNLAQYCGATNASISMLMSSLEQLRNSLATAFAPILNAIAPILDFFIRKLSSVISAIGMFISALTGRKTFVRARRVQQDYAASLGGAAVGAGKAAKGSEKMAKGADDATKANERLKKSLLGFDEINKLTDFSHPALGKNGKGAPGIGNSPSNGGGGGGIGDLGFGNMFEEIPIDQKFRDLAQMIKDAWEKADFTEIGAIVGRKLNEALSRIPWDKIKETTWRLAKSIATFLNGFIEATDWGLVGKTLAEGINTAFLFLGTFIENFHWGSVGRAIGDGLNAVVSNINWQYIGQTLAKGANGILTIVGVAAERFNWRNFGKAISNGINAILITFDWAYATRALSKGVKGILETLIAAITGLDWRKLGSAIIISIENIDWFGIASTIIEFLSSIPGMALRFLDGIISEAIGSIFTKIKDYFQSYIDELGGNIILGLLTGILKAIPNFGSWVWDHIVWPFIRGLLEGFGIASPSKQMMEIGYDIIAGLVQGLRERINDVVTWFFDLPNKIRGAIGNAKEWLQEKGRNIIDGIRSGYELAKENMLLPRLRKLGQEAIIAVGNAHEWLIIKGQNIIEGIRNGYEAVREGLFLSRIRQLGQEAFFALGDTAASVQQKGVDFINGLINGYESHKHSLLSRISQLPGSIRAALGDLWGVGRNFIASFINGVRSLQIKLPHLHWKTSIANIGRFHVPYPSWNIAWYEKGGFPNAGDMFIANESGPELVGKMGNKNVVANEHQIIDGIKKGVKDAMIEAMMMFIGSYESSTPPVLEFVLNCDSETLYKVVQQGKEKIERRYEVTMQV